MDIQSFVISKETTGKSVAFVIRKGALSYDEKGMHDNENKMLREDIIKHIVKVSGDDPIIYFLAVGSTGHSSSVALGLAINKPEIKIWSVDRDGAVLMHMDSMAVIGANCPDNLVHVIINNGAHETVGGMSTVAGTIDLAGVARACGYPYTVCVDNFEDLNRELTVAKQRGELSLIKVKCSIGARDDLGRPKTTTIENEQNFMEYIGQLK